MTKLHISETAGLTHKRFMAKIDRSLRRMAKVLELVKKMDHADRYYLLSRLKDRECCQEHREQMGGRSV